MSDRKITPPSKSKVTATVNTPTCHCLCQCTQSVTIKGPCICLTLHTCNLRPPGVARAAVSAKYIILNTNFLVFNAKSLVFTHLQRLREPIHDVSVPFSKRHFQRGRVVLNARGIHASAGGQQH